MTDTKARLILWFVPAILIFLVTWGTQSFNLEGDTLRLALGVGALGSSLLSLLWSGAEVEYWFMKKPPQKYYDMTGYAKGEDLLALLNDLTLEDWVWYPPKFIIVGCHGGYTRNTFEGRGACSGFNYTATSSPKVLPAFLEKLDKAGLLKGAGKGAWDE